MTELMNYLCVECFCIRKLLKSSIECATLVHICETFLTLTILIIAIYTTDGTVSDLNIYMTKS